MSVIDVIARTLAFAIITAFVWIGGVALFTAIQHGPLKFPLDPEVSSDSVLSHIGGPHPTKTVNEMLRPWSEDKVLLVIAPVTSPYSTGIYYELLVLGYPRRIPAIICDSSPAGSSAKYHEEFALSNIDGLIFFDIVPGPGVAGVRQIAPNLFIAPYQGVPSWNSFCP